ncbi:MAG: histidine kinase [Pseudobacteriovorax sp.]|nr:histidine kinase [Pseudobacteriovorax sp.]
MLTHKMRPHFLFNTLNSIKATMIESPEAASKVITELGSLYRKILQGGESVCWGGDEEMALVKDCLQLQKLRFEHRLTYSLKFDDSKGEYSCPCFSIQTLVENSIKHSIAKSLRGGSILIQGYKDNEEYCIMISDEVEDENSASIEYTGHGLENLEARLNLSNARRPNLNFETHKYGTKVRFWLSP